MRPGEVFLLLSRMSFVCLDYIDDDAAECAAAAAAAAAVGRVDQVYFRSVEGVSRYKCITY